MTVVASKKSFLNHFKSTFSPNIIIPCLIIIIGLSLLCGFFPQKTNLYLGGLKHFFTHDLSWFYVMSVGIFFFILLYLAFSKFGKMKLGTNDSRPDYSFFSWVSMLFSAGMGIGLMFFGVAEPLSHYMYPAAQALGNPERVQFAQVYTFLHWGIHGWAIYAIVGLALAYFSYRYRLPLSIRSTLYPLLKQRIHGPIGDMADVFALCSTFFGLTTTLGFGVVQLNAGLVDLGILPDTDFKYQVMLVCFVMFVAILSAISGIGKGVKILSQINIVSAVLLMLFILIVGPTGYVVGTFFEGLGIYFQKFFFLTFDTHTYEPQFKEWFSDWTVWYWAWWISWSPYVGLFIARISKGRTIREYIIAVLFIPSIFVFLWMTIFGNSAIWLDEHVVNGALGAMVNKPEHLLFKFLDVLPGSFITSALSILILCIFFVTSADSAIYVMNDISTKNSASSPKWQKIFWGVMLGGLALILLNMGGLSSLQTMTILSSIPFAIVMLVFCFCLIKAINLDASYFKKEYSPSTVNWSGKYWKKQLERILTYGERNDVRRFLQVVARPALQDLVEELEENGIEAKLRVRKKPLSIELVIEHEKMKNFYYGVKMKKRIISDTLLKEGNAPQVESSAEYIPISFFKDGRVGYDIQYFNKEGLISDVLKQYERFISFSSDRRNDLFISE